jgi:3'-phosphoadenosine 5'-phosphosulfate sulfotransferase (PAPS reductase)/FAD synthetase
MKNINSELTQINIFIVDLIFKYLKLKVKYSSSFKSDNSIKFMIAIERLENQEEESIEGIFVNSLLEYNEQYLQQFITSPNIDITQYETELQVFLMIEYIS